MAKKKVKEQIDTQEVVKTVEEIVSPEVVDTPPVEEVEDAKVEGIGEDNQPEEPVVVSETESPSTESEEEKSLENIPVPEVPQPEEEKKDEVPTQEPEQELDSPVRVGEAYIHKCLPGVPDHYSKYTVRIKTDNGYRDINKVAKAKAREIAINYNKEKGINSTKIFED